MSSIAIRTERLLLRQWKTEDFKIFSQMNSDNRVREFFPSLLTDQQSNCQALEFQQIIAKNGYGFWAVETIDTGQFIGMMGLCPIDMKAHFCPNVEIGWRLAYQFWGKGYATEGAKACLQYGFEKLHLKEIVAFTAEKNIRSCRVMEKIGMTYNTNDDFIHPKVDEANPLKKHVLYRISDLQLPCPCCSGFNYGKCCHVFHKGLTPKSALDLMRSRYTAYCFWPF